MSRIERMDLDGVLVLAPDVHADPRGSLVETWRSDGVRAAGILDPFVQENQSRSRQNALRGLHFQSPPGQAKLIRVARGAIQDVAVDIRRESPTYGQHLAVILDDIQHRQLYLPPGFAHGFCVLSDEADVVYRLSRYYDPELERGVAWDDPALGIQWAVTDPILSERDRSNPRLSDLPTELTKW
jgi:dTDP-4-dehydrorhamnose 3,5-epimerase